MYPTCRLRRIGPKHRQRQQRLAPQPCVLVRGGALRHGGGGLGRGLGAQVPQRHQRLVAQVAARVAQHPRQGCGGIGRRTVTHDAQTTAGADASEASTNGQIVEPIQIGNVNTAILSG